MPALPRAFVKLALAWLVIALVGRVAVALRPSLSSWELPLLHALVFGWLTQLAMGVAWWMLPRPRTRGARLPLEPLVVVACVSLNAGLLLRCTSEPLSSDSAVRTTVLVLAAALQAVAVIAFAVPAWLRVSAAARREGS